MTVLSYQSIVDRQIFTPFCDRTEHAATGLTYGCGAASYDVRLDDDVVLSEGALTLASTIERFEMPDDVCGIVHDKSSLARAGILVQNTFIDPGWCGFLTLEITFHKLQGKRIKPTHIHHLINPLCCRLEAGTPIAQIVFHTLDQTTARPYEGDYQDQSRGARASKFSIHTGNLE